MERMYEKRYRVEVFSNKHKKVCREGHQGTFSSMWWLAKAQEKVLTTKTYNCDLACNKLEFPQFY